MKPVVICRFAPHEGPGYFATHLSSRRVPWRVLKLDAGEALPDCSGISGLALMGGPMSVNDPLPWVAPVLELIRECVAADVPVIGHCLGGQLMAKALGGAVTTNPVKEIGWGAVEVSDAAEAGRWTPQRGFLSYHWHGETFTLPSGAVRIWSSAHCANQAFALGKHLGMQCHVEITPEMIDEWCETGAEEIAGSVGTSPAVQSPDAMRENLRERIEALRVIAAGVYDRWLEGLKST